MNTPRWILPTVSVVAAIAMAVTGVLVGSTFADHTTRQVPSGTETVAVIAPVSTGQEPADADAPEGTIAETVSNVVAEREVRLPAADPSALDPEMLDLIESLTQAPDPILELIRRERAAEGDGASGSDDPCAAGVGADGVAADESECPEGLRSTILPMVAKPDLVVTAVAYPPTREGEPDPTAGLLTCTDLDVSATSVPIGIFSTVPAIFTVHFWPSFRPGRVSEADAIETSASETANFEDALLNADDPMDIPLLSHCATLDDLEPDTAYTAEVIGVDADFRLSPPHTFRFNSGGAPTHPGLRIIPVSDNLIFASAMHPENQDADIRAIIGTPDETPTCSEVDSSMPLMPLTDTETDTTEESRNFEQAPREFTRKHVVTFAAPEGSTVLVCARWYNAGGVPSWEQVQPLFESSAIVQAPDRLNPKVELTRIFRPASTLQKVRIAISTERGRYCGSGTWNKANGYDSFPVLLCDSTGNTGAAKVDSRGFVSDRGASNDLVVRVAATFIDGTTTQPTVYIHATDGGCRGVCSLPRDAYYRFAMDLTDVPHGLCGSSFGECTPPTEEVSAGTLQLKVSWEQGDTNGQQRWSVSPTHDVAPEYVTPDEAQFDKAERWRIDEPRFENSTAIGPPVPYVAGHFTLTVDRPVDYTIRFMQGRELTQAERCDPTGGALQVSGHTESSTDVEMPGLCLGATYFPEIVLTDDEGNTSLWSLLDRVRMRGAQSTIRVPGIVAKVSVRFEASSGFTSALRGFGVTVGDINFDSERARANTCHEGGSVTLTSVKNMGLPTMVTISGGMILQEFGTGSDQRCLAYNGLRRSVNASVRVPVAELFTVEGVTLTTTSDDGALPMELTVTARHP